MKKIILIIQREFNERVRRKSFIIATLLVPLVMIILMVAPAWIMSYATGDKKQIVVIDRSGVIAPMLESDEEVCFEVVNHSLDSLRKESSEHFGILYIGEHILEDATDVTLYANAATSITLESHINHQIEKIAELQKWKRYHIDGIEQMLAEVKTDVHLQVVRMDREGGTDDSLVASVVALVLGMTLYMILLIYGAMVMQSVIEEKSSRVLEVVVSSVSPFELMMGKILGIASVAVVQLVIWGVLICGIGSVVVQHVVPTELLVATSDGTPGIGDFLALAMDVRHLIMLFVYLLLFMIGGYLFYSAMFAAVGSAVDNVQDASQLQTPVMLPLILSMLVSMAVMNDPNTSLAFWFSMIPFTSPVVMISRIPYGIASWEIGLSLVLLYLSFIGMAWVAGRIYRVGIFMYGKRPTLKEIYRWIRYK